MAHLSLEQHPEHPVTAEDVGVTVASEGGQT